MIQAPSNNSVAVTIHGNQIVEVGCWPKIADISSDGNMLETNGNAAHSDIVSEFQGNTHHAKGNQSVAIRANVGMRRLRV